MLKKVKIILLFTLLYGVFMVAMFPASMAVNMAKSWNLVPANVNIGSVSGSVWQGKVNQVTFKGIAFEHIRWQLSALPILMGNIDVDLNVGRRGSDIKAQGNVVLSRNSVNVSDFTLSTPIEPITQLSPLPYGLKSYGKLNLTIDDFVTGKPWCESLKGTVVATSVLLKSALGKLDVDKFTAKLTCPQGKLLATMVPKTNSLGIDGSAQVNKARQYLVNAKVVPPSNASQDYLNVLRFSGVANSQGQYTFQFKGSL